MRLAGQVALVTGAGAGIGRGIATAFAREGADVALCDLNAEALEGTRAAVGGVGRRTLAKQVDVRDAVAVEGFVQETARTFGRLDVLVNNAAIMPVAPLETMSESAIDQVLQVNLRGPILFSKYAIPHLRRAGGGSILHMASVTGHSGFAGVVVYGATKGALLALARGQAIELAKDNIRVNTISPGTVDSPMLHHFLREHARDPQKARLAFDRLHPRGRVATIDEVAAAFVFLASGEAANITGADLRCDGGFTAQGLQPRE
jgi:NAD(P)-dependent dehydrogenase (short-subunit alcohol dehydrogenase family)